jgi:hypothetical protein
VDSAHPTGQIGTSPKTSTGIHAYSKVFHPPFLAANSSVVTGGTSFTGTFTRIPVPASLHFASCNLLLRDRRNLPGTFRAQGLPLGELCPSSGGDIDLCRLQLAGYGGIVSDERSGTLRNEGLIGNHVGVNFKT